MKHNKRLLRGGIAAALIAAFSLGYVLISGAVWDETQAVHIDPAEIPASTLIIGTHLIHLSALSDSLYEVAERSAEESGQTNMYYKSELAEGAWFDITSATTLADITTEGSPVSDDVIAALFFTHHTKDDGVTYDLRTGLPVDVRDIYSPYDLESMEELYPLKTQYDMLKETQSESDAGKAKINRIASFFATSVINDTTINYDSELAALQVYYDVLNENDGGTVEKNAVQSVMDAVDASRRVAVFTIVEEALATYLEELSTVTDTQDEEGNTQAGAMPDTNLQSAVSDSLNNVRSSKTTYEGKMLDAGTTVTTSVRYTLSRALIDDAVAQNHSACDEDVIQLVALENIVDGVIYDSTSELALLDGSLITQATSTYSAALLQGENAEYAAAVAQNAASVLLQSIANDSASILNSYRSELEFFIDAKTQRMGTDEAMAYIDERLTLTEGWYVTLPDDAFLDGATASVDAHVEFLTQLRRELELSAGGNELDELAAQKGDLQTQMMSCLDNNDLAGAKALEEQIADIDAQIQSINDAAAANLADLENQRADLENQLANASGDAADELKSQIAALDTQIAQAEASMGDGSLGALVSQLKNDGLAAVDDGDLDTANDCADALNNLLPQDTALVMPALQELYLAMSKAQAVNGDDYSDAMAGIESAILNNADAYAAAMRTERTVEDLIQIADDFFAGQAQGGLLDATGGTGSGGTGGIGGTGTGGTGTGGTGTGGTGTGGTGAGGTGTGGTGAGGTGAGGTGTGGTGAGGIGTGGAGLLSTSQTNPAVNLAALQMYYKETGSQAALSLIPSIAQQQMALGNPLVFLRVNDAGREYLPLTALRGYTGMRYVWNQNLSLGTLAKGGTYYGFTAYSDMVKRSQDDSQSDRMTNAAKFQNGVIHVYEEYTYEQFGAQAYYLSGTSYGVLYDDAMMEQALSLFAAFLGE